MSDSDIAAKTGIPLPFVQAIRAIESGGIASAVRFEPHVFRRFHPDAVRLLDRSATDADRAAAWSSHLVPYTPGETRAASPIRVETDRQAFEYARRIDAGAAIRATSWGAFQVLGAHLLGLYSQPDEAIAQFDRAPLFVSDALLVVWLRANPHAVAAAKAGDVPEWVRCYNGSIPPAADYYITKMRKALDAAHWPTRG